MGTSSPCEHVQFAPCSVKGNDTMKTCIPKWFALKLYVGVDSTVQNMLFPLTVQVVILFPFLLHDARFVKIGMEHEIAQELPCSLHVVVITSSPEIIIKTFTAPLHHIVI